MSTDYQLIEDNSGFVNFPNHRNQENKTLVYLVSFEPKVKKSLLSNVNLIIKMEIENVKKHVAKEFGSFWEII